MAGSAQTFGEGGRCAVAGEVLYYVGGVSDNESDFNYLNFAEAKWHVGPKLLQGRNGHGTSPHRLPYRAF